MDKTETKEMQGEHEERSIIGFFFGAGPYDGYWYGDTPKDKRPPFWWRTKLREEVIQLRSELQKAKELNGELVEGLVRIKSGFIPSDFMYQLIESLIKKSNP